MSNRSKHPKSLSRTLLALVLSAPLLFLNASSGLQQQSSTTAPASSSKSGPIPDRVLRLNNLGTAYMNQQQFAQALKMFEQAAAIDRANSVIKLNQAIALFNMQQFDRARTLLEEVTRMDKSNAHAWYVLGLIDKNTGKVPEATADFQQATALAPEDADAWYFLASSQAQEGHQQEAIAAYEHALHLSPLHASAEFGLARSYQKAGNEADARKHMARFRQLTESKVSHPMGVAYGDQGVLSLVEQLPGATRVPAATAGVFTDITASSGLPTWIATTAEAAASGACFIDFDNDGLFDIFLPRGPNRHLALYKNLGHGKFQNVTAKAGLSDKPAGRSCAAGDYDNDGFTDMAVSGDSGFSLLRNNGKGKFEDTTVASGIGTNHNAQGIVFVDLDHDGDLDLYLVAERGANATDTKNAYWRNNGDGKFTNVTAELALGDALQSTQAIATDFNNDRAVDLTIGAAKPVVYTNPREGVWHSSSAAGADSVVALALGDFDKDGWPDVVASRSSQPALSVWHNEKGASYAPTPVAVPGWTKAFGVATLDYDNDGWVDIAAIGETPNGKRELRLFRNLGPGGFQEVTHETGLDRVALGKAVGLYTADLDADGAVDMLITQEDRGPMLLRNEIGQHNNFIRLALKGLADSKTAIGTKIEVFAGTLYQRWELSPSAYLGQNSTELIAGLGDEKAPDVVRLLWPTGVVQDEIDVAAKQRTVITEIDRRGSSCPVLFAWDGKHYQFVTDMLGAGVLGHWVSPTEKNIPDPTEYVKLEGVSPVRKNGLLSFRLMEPLEEAVFIDAVRLLAIDHPGYADVYPNEYFSSQPPYPDFKVIRSHNAVSPLGAWDDTGHDVLPLLLHRDKRYPKNFKMLQWAGFTQPHSLELKLPAPYNGGPLRLLMNGYIEYFTATSMYAAHQAGVDPFAPYVEALEADGKWVKVIDDMGFPAGLPRTMVADLTGKLPRETQRIRLTTNLQIYWDQILVDTTPDDAVPVEVTDAKLASAKLAFHGYPRMIEAGSPGDVRFVYEEASPTGPFARQPGAYTRTGDVLSLVSSTDDKFAVFGSGDELQLDFDPASLPPLKPGWKRDYFFFANGYEKDMDFYAADGLTVGPMPFRSMKTYPYPSDQPYPEDSDHLNYQLEFNSREFSGTEPPSYRFAYPHSTQKR